VKRSGPGTFRPMLLRAKNGRDLSFRGRNAPATADKPLALGMAFPDALDFPDYPDADWTAVADPNFDF
jgi:hypothetical protein